MAGPKAAYNFPAGFSLLAAPITLTRRVGPIVSNTKAHITYGTLTA
jgi:hypothetical protein